MNVPKKSHPTIPRHDIPAMNATLGFTTAAIAMTAIANGMNR